MKKQQEAAAQHENVNESITQTLQEFSPQKLQENFTDGKVTAALKENVIRSIKREQKQKILPASQESLNGKKSKEKYLKKTKRPQENAVPQKRFKTEKKPNISDRFNKTLEHLPQIDKSRLVRCKNEGCNKKSYVWCSSCSIHLCLCVIEDRNCFADYHTLKVENS